MKNTANITHVMSSDTIEDSSEKMWSTIASSQIKRRCLNEFRKAMSNDAIDQRVCAACACLHYKVESSEINIANIPNQHLLYPSDALPYEINPVQEVSGQVVQVKHFLSHKNLSHSIQRADSFFDQTHKYLAS